MAFGNEGDKNTGGWTYQPPRKINDDPVPAQQIPTPPAQSSPPAEQPKGKVTPDSVAALAASVLPNIDDARKFSIWRTEAMPALVEAVLAKAGIDESKFTTKIKALDKAITDALQSLNKKETGESRPEPEGESCPVLPGSCTDPTCVSLFDINDLAIRGEKAVTSKRVYMPLIFPDFLLDTNQAWGLGQKVEFLQEWRHKGFTLGSLISSFSLLPGEEVTIEVSSWQRTKSEVQQEKDEATIR